MNNSIYTDKQLIDLAKKENEPYDKGQWWKKLDVKISKLSKSLKNHWESLKDQGLKIKILEGKDIDDFLASVKD